MGVGAAGRRDFGWSGPGSGLLCRGRRAGHGSIPVPCPPPSRKAPAATAALSARRV